MYFILFILMLVSANGKSWWRRNGWKRPVVYDDDDAGIYGDGFIDSRECFT